MKIITCNKKHNHCCLIVAMILLTVGLESSAQSTDVAIQRPWIQAFHLRSDILKQDMLVEVHLPLTYGLTQDSVTYPVVYSADGLFSSLMIGTDNQLSSTFLTHIPEVITVGFDFLEYNECMRLQWYTPTQIPDDELCNEIGGGADQYIAFIEYELKPYINSIYRANQSQEAFLGHSLTGLLSLYIFITNNDLFDMYIASSPSLYWDNELMYDYLSDFINQNSSFDQPVYISVGLNEGAGNATFSQIVFSYVFRFGRELMQGFPESKVGLIAYPSEDHGSVVSRAIHDGMKFIFSQES